MKILGLTFTGCRGIKSDSKIGMCMKLDLARHNGRHKNVYWFGPLDGRGNNLSPISLVVALAYEYEITKSENL